MFFNSRKSRKRAEEDLGIISLASSSATVAETSRQSVVDALFDVNARIAKLTADRIRIEAELEELVVIRDALSPAIATIDFAESLIIEQETENGNDPVSPNVG